MSYENARNFIVENPDFYLTPDKSGKGYICPICGSGTGKNGTGLTTKDGRHFTCWRGCFTHEDIIDIIGRKNGLRDFKDKLAACHQRIPASSTFDKADTSQKTKTNNNPNNITAPTDYSDFFESCLLDRGRTNYLNNRGISDEIQNRFKIGFCAEWQSPTALKKGKKPPATPRIIIPTSRYGYIARDTRPAESVPENEWKYAKMKEGKAAIFNIEAIRTSQVPVFVAEGEIDALSIITEGYESIAIGSVAYCGIFLDYLKNNKPSSPLLIALDSDEAGTKAAEKLICELNKIGVECYQVDINGGHKDANEHLMTDREGFRKSLEVAIKTAQTSRGSEKHDYLSNSAAYHLDDFLNNISDSVNTPCVPTGFAQLDETLDGGLYEGLYVVGAISSLGKTTFALQIADQIAQNGRDVLIFSLEMARYELMAKSISRLTMKIVESRNEKRYRAKTTRGITVKRRYDDYENEEKQIIDDAFNEYRGFANNVFIMEGVGDIGATAIRNTVEKHISYTTRKPVCVLDYLQIMAPYNDRSTDKQNTDRNVIELKRISRDYKIPVIGISSFNRDNYNTCVSMQAFKESGAIEYSSDVLIGLQLKGAGEKLFNVDEQKAKNPREIELKVLKNRNGKTGGVINLLYYPEFNYFKESIANDHRVR